MSDRLQIWASTMQGSLAEGSVVLAHGDGSNPTITARPVTREVREEIEHSSLALEATKAFGAGNRAKEEEPDQWRTCFERDRDRILHSSSFRRLAGKTQVFVFPGDHQRTRLTHALEVTQVATAIGRAIGLNETVLFAMGAAHDVGHTPGGHSGESALESFLPDFHHAVWGADVVLQPLNLCAEILDGVRCHSWSLPSPSTLEGHVLSWADRIAYCTHDFEDAVSAGIVTPDELPSVVSQFAGTSRSRQINAFVEAIVDCAAAKGTIGMAEDAAAALAGFRAFNYERIYMRPESVDQEKSVIAVLRALVEFFLEDPLRIPNLEAEIDDPLQSAVAYVAGMTDRFAFESAVELLGWDKDRLPRGIDSPYGKLAA